VRTITKLLSPEDPAPFYIENPDGSSPFLFVSDHAGGAIPQQLGDLGLDQAELSRHIGYDIGIYGVTTRIAQALEAAYIFQPYSRLVIDCNRQPGNPQSVVIASDTTIVPANANLTETELTARETEILAPYQEAIALELQARAASGRPTVLIAMHSCTDRLRSDNQWRPWEIAVIAENDWRLGDALVQVLQSNTGLNVGINQPYTVNMTMDYTVPVHAVANGIPYVEIEIRQDLIGDDAGQMEWSTLLTKLFPTALTQSRLVAN
jgi:predicted N-formylglutamate amidohydrolase